MTRLLEETIVRTMLIRWLGKRHPRVRMADQIRKLIIHIPPERGLIRAQARSTNPYQTCTPVPRPLDILLLGGHQIIVVIVEVLQVVKVEMAVATRITCTGGVGVKEVAGHSTILEIR